MSARLGRSGQSDTRDAKHVSRVFGEPPSGTPLDRAMGTVSAAAMPCDVTSHTHNMGWPREMPTS